MGYRLILEGFEGPLDLLLHLVSKNKVKIEDISITEITNQYVVYIQQMQELDMEIASEFLIMAATLIHIKSCKLLPALKTPTVEAEDYTEQELMQRLLEYKKYKQIAHVLGERHSIHSDVHYRLPMEVKKNDGDEAVLTGSCVGDLLAATTKVAIRKKTPPKLPFVHTIEKEIITVKSKIAQLRLFFETRERIGFFDLFTGNYKRADIVITFMAILEMVNKGLLELHQVKPFDEMTVRRKESKWTKKR